MAQPELSHCPRCALALPPSVEISPRTVVPSLSTPYDALAPKVLAIPQEELCSRCVLSVAVTDEMFHDLLQGIESLKLPGSVNTFHSLEKIVVEEMERKLVGWACPKYLLRPTGPGKGTQTKVVDPKEGAGEAAEAERLRRVEAGESEQEEEEDEDEYFREKKRKMREYEEAAAKAAKKEKNSNEEPPAFKSYSLRAFSNRNQIAGIGFNDTNQRLKDELQWAREDGTLWTLDWRNMKLSQVKIQKEREAMATLEENGGYMVGRRSLSTDEY